MSVAPTPSVYDFAQRSNTRSVNRKSYENLVYGGAFDELWPLNRAQFFAKTENGCLRVLSALIKYGKRLSKHAKQFAIVLIRWIEVASYIPEPAMPDAEEWPLIEKLKYEKEVIGIYLTGHPLDNYKLEMEKYCNTTIAELKNMQKARSGEGGDEIMAKFAAP
jgi:DNA polymerase-3 subunit alpha